MSLSFRELFKNKNVKIFSLAITILVVILTGVIGVRKAQAATVCSPATAITVPFAKDGVGDVCLQASSLCNNINSWNLTTLEVNGTSYLNTYVAGSSIAPLNGGFTIHYVSTVAWGHFEIDAPCGTSPTATTGVVLTATRTNTPIMLTPTGSKAFTATITRTSTITITPTGSRPASTSTRTPTRTITPSAVAETVAPTRTVTVTPTGSKPPSTSTPTRTSTATSIPVITNTPTTVVSAGCGTLVLCDTFEGQTVGTAPSGLWQPIYPDCSGTGTVTVDSTQAHSGTKSIKVDGKTGYCNHVFFGNTTNMAAIGPVVFGRVFIRPTTALGTDHIAFMAMKDANDGNKNLRFGGQGQVMAWNRESDDATVPSMSPVGISTSTGLPVNQWSCLEMEIDGNNGFLQVWLNGTSIAGLTVDGVSTADIDAAWRASKPVWHPSLTDLKFGWESYSSGDNTLWFDDVAFGASRVGCGS